MLKLHVVLQQCKSKMKQGVIEKLVEHHSDQSCMCCCGNNNPPPPIIQQPMFGYYSYKHLYLLGHTAQATKHSSSTGGLGGVVVVMLLRHRHQISCSSARCLCESRKKSSDCPQSHLHLEGKDH